MQWSLRNYVLRPKRDEDYASGFAAWRWLADCMTLGDTSCVREFHQYEGDKEWKRILSTGGEAKDRFIMCTLIGQDGKDEELLNQAACALIAEADAILRALSIPSKKNDTKRKSTLLYMQRSLRWVEQRLTVRWPEPQ